MRHSLKIEEKYYKRIEENVKSFEVRFNDRDYQVNDTIEFNVLGKSSPAGYWPGTLWEIVYIHSGLGMQDGYVVLSLIKKGLGNGGN